MSTDKNFNIILILFFGVFIIYILHPTPRIVYTS